jgi:S1-C subfamily serine protease
VQAVTPGSSADAAGLQGIGGDGTVADIVVSVEDRPVATSADLALALERVGIGNEATLEVLRDGIRRTITVKVQDISRQGIGGIE